MIFKITLCNSKLILSKDRIQPFITQNTRQAIDLWTSMFRYIHLSRVGLKDLRPNRPPQLLSFKAFSFKYDLELAETNKFSYNEMLFKVTSCRAY